MRLLWARVGVPYSPATGLPIESQTVSQMVDRVLALPEGTRLYLLAPVVRGRKGEYRKELAELQKRASSASRSTASSTRSPRRRRSTRSSSTTSTSWSTASWCARTSAAPGRFSFETALELADGIAVAENADAEGRRARSAPAHRVLVEIRLPGLRLHHRGDRAAAVLVQQSRTAPARPATAGHEQQVDADLVMPDEAEPAQGRGRALGRVAARPITPDAAGAGAHYKLHARRRRGSELPEKRATRS
jgi:excinuclease ABC subunit A